MKFGRIVLQVNTYQLIEPVFRHDNIFSRRHTWCHFTQKCCRLVGAHTASARRLCSSVHHFLVYSTLILVQINLS